MGFQKENKFKKLSFKEGTLYDIDSINSTSIRYRNIMYMGKQGIHHIFKMHCDNGASWLFTQTDAQLMNKKVSEVIQL